MNEMKRCSFSAVLRELKPITRPYLPVGGLCQIEIERKKGYNWQRSLSEVDHREGMVRRRHVQQVMGGLRLLRFGRFRRHNVQITVNLSNGTEKNKRNLLKFYQKEEKDWTEQLPKSFRVVK